MGKKFFINQNKLSFKLLKNFNNNCLNKCKDILKVIKEKHKGLPKEIKNAEKEINKKITEKMKKFKRKCKDTFEGRRVESFSIKKEAKKLLARVKKEETKNSNASLNFENLGKISDKIANLEKEIYGISFNDQDYKKDSAIMKKTLKLLDDKKFSATLRFDEYEEDRMEKIFSIKINEKEHRFALLFYPKSAIQGKSAIYLKTLDEIDKLYSFKLIFSLYDGKKFLSMNLNTDRKSKNENIKDDTANTFLGGSETCWGLSKWYQTRKIRNFYKNLHYILIQVELAKLYPAGLENNEY